MDKLRKYIGNLTTPKNCSRLGIRYWQERILLNLLFAATVMGFVVYFPSVGLSIKEHLYVVAILDTLIYIFVVFLLLSSRISYTFRALSFSAISYLLGLVLMFVLGPFGAGPVWLFAFPVLTGAFLGLKSGVIALIINAMTILGTGVLAFSGVFQWGSSTINPIEKWTVTGLNFMLLNIIVVISVASILKGLQQSLEQLEKSEQKYRRIFENIQDVYYEESLDGIIQEISPSIEKISLYSPKDIRNKAFHEFYDMPNNNPPPFQQILKKGSISDYEIHLRDRDNSIRICSINASLLRDKEKNPTGIVGIFRDISEQEKMVKKNKELQNELNRARKMEALGLLAGGVAHDLNNILSAIVGYPELLLLDLDADSPLRKPLLTIKSSGRKAAEIIQDLLTMSRRGVTSREVLDLNEMVLDFIQTPEFKQIFNYHPRSRMKKQLSARSPLILGSSVHISKTIMNLISNAAEAQPDGGDITISTDNIFIDTPIKGYTRVEPGHYVTLKVQDEGIGIDGADLERIFEPFFTKKIMGRSGTGLGMAVVWGTVQDHDGYIDIKSTPDVGTAFTLYFPVTSQEKKKEPTSSSFDHYRGNGEHILVVDDLKEQREVTTIMLEKLNYRVSSVESGEKAVVFVTTANVDLLILDMIMEPGIDGLETYRRIIEIRPGQKAIIASGYSETARVKEMMALGAGQYIKKPYGLNDIGKTVKEVLST
jgi:PAS domain S-box-containing protein